MVQASPALSLGGVEVKLQGSASNKSKRECVKHGKGRQGHVCLEVTQLPACSEISLLLRQQGWAVLASHLLLQSGHLLFQRYISCDISNLVDLYELVGDLNSNEEEKGWCSLEGRRMEINWVWTNERGSFHFSILARSTLRSSQLSLLTFVLPLGNRLVHVVLQVRSKWQTQLGTLFCGKLVP